MVIIADIFAIIALVVLGFIAWKVISKKRKNREE